MVHIFLKYKSKKNLISARRNVQAYVTHVLPNAMLLSHSVVSNSATPGTVPRQAPLLMGFPRQEYWSGLPCPPPGDLPNPGIEPRSPVL